MYRGGNAPSKAGSSDDRPDDRLIAERLALQPLFDRTARLIGQAAGLLLLATAGSDLDRQRSHLAIARAQFAELLESYRALGRGRTQTASRQAVAKAIHRLGPLLDRFELHFAATLGSATEIAVIAGELGAVRVDLQSGACPHLGLSVVDLGGACCAQRH